MTAAVRSVGAAPSRPQLWRVSDRTSFQALRSGRRVRRGPLSVTYLAPDPAVGPTPPRVAFAIGKAAGGAVVRNRLRRRLRAGLRELAAQGHLPSGTYLLGASPAVADLAWPELVADLKAAVDSATEQASA